MIFHAMQVKRKSFQHTAAFLERHVAEGCPAHLACKLVCRLEVNAVGGRDADHIPGDRVMKLRALTKTLHPAVLNQILYLVHMMWLCDEGTDSLVWARLNSVGLGRLLGGIRCARYAKGLSWFLDESDGSFDEFTIIFGQTFWRNQNAFSIFIA